MSGWRPVRSGIPQESAVVPVLIPLSVTWTVELIAPSAPLWMTPNCVVLSNMLEGNDAVQRDFDRLER